MKAITIPIGFLVVMAVCVGFTMHQDYKAELEDRRIYCENVRDGIWPDYNDSFKYCYKGTKKPKPFKNKFVNPV